MYMSRVKLKRENERVYSMLNDINTQHRDLMRTLPPNLGHAPRRAAGLLYRLMDSPDELTVYATTYAEPNWAALQFIGYELNEVRVRNVTFLRNEFIRGRRASFELQASPVRQWRDECGFNHPLFIHSREGRADWLYKQSYRYGFELESFAESRMQHVYGCKRNRVIHLTAVLFTGTLRIMSEDLFWEAFCTGIGTGKPYGLGMLMVGLID